MIRILLIVPSSSGTIARCSFNLYRALRVDSRFNVRVCLLNKSKREEVPFEEEYCLAGTPSGIISRCVRVVKGVLYLKKIKKNWEPDVTIGTLNVASAYNVLSGGDDFKIGIFHGKFLYGKGMTERVLPYLWGRFCYRFLFSKLDRLFCVSQEIATFVKSLVAKCDEKIKVVYNVHDIEGIHCLSKKDLPEDLTSFFQKKVFIFIGRLDRNKAPMRAFRSFRRLIERGEDAHLLFLGKDCGEKASIQKDALDCGLLGRVAFVDYDSNPYRYLARAYALISTSISEGLPGVHIESLILNVPVISTASSLGVYEILNISDDAQLKEKGWSVANFGIVISSHESEEKIESYLAEALFYICDNKNYQGLKHTPSRFLEEITPKRVVEHFYAELSAYDE